jgi:amidohydrolase
MNSIASDAEALFPYLQSMRRDFHRHPELGFQEKRTAEIVASELSKLGIDVTTGVAKTGVIGILKGSHPGPVVLARFDMDALPVTEETGADYSSLNPGIMHACGHDGHVAIGLATARLLAERRDDLHGTVKFIFQPAEEGQGGAEAMLNAGILENPSVDFALGMHLWNQIPVGWMGVADGPVMAGSDIFEVKVSGKGGHGAMPNETIDPVVATAQIVVALQSIVSRNVSPLHSAVVSVTQFQAGEAFNVIPPQALLRGTIRTYEASVHDLVVERFTQIVQNIAAGYGCGAQIDLRSLTPAVLNDPSVSDVVRSAAKTLYEDIQIDESYQTMTSEDMSFILQRVKGCYFFLGTANAKKGLIYGHHHPQFDFDEAMLPRGAAIMTAAVLNILKA